MDKGSPRRSVVSGWYPTLGLARKREIQLKKWSRDKKEALIAGDVAMLKNLSRYLQSHRFGLHEAGKLRCKFLDPHQARKEPPRTLEP